MITFTAPPGEPRRESRLPGHIFPVRAGRVLGFAAKRVGLAVRLALGVDRSGRTGMKAQERVGLWRLVADGWRV